MPIDIRNDRMYRIVDIDAPERIYDQSASIYFYDFDQRDQGFKARYELFKKFDEARSDDDYVRPGMFIVELENNDEKNDNNVEKISRVFYDKFEKGLPLYLKRKIFPSDKFPNLEIIGVNIEEIYPDAGSLFIPRTPYDPYDPNEVYEGSHETPQMPKIKSKSISITQSKHKIISAEQLAEIKNINKTLEKAINKKRVIKNYSENKNKKSIFAKSEDAVINLIKNINYIKDKIEKLKAKLQNENLNSRQINEALNKYEKFSLELKELRAQYNTDQQAQKLIDLMILSQHKTQNDQEYILRLAQLTGSSPEKIKQVMEEQNILTAPLREKIENYKKVLPDYQIPEQHTELIQKFYRLYRIVNQGRVNTGSGQVNKLPHLLSKNNNGKLNIKSLDYNSTPEPSPELGYLTDFKKTPDAKDKKRKKEMLSPRSVKHKTDSTKKTDENLLSDINNVNKNSRKKY